MGSFLRLRPLSGSPEGEGRRASAKPKLTEKRRTRRALAEPKLTEKKKKEKEEF